MRKVGVLLGLGLVTLVAVAIIIVALSPGGFGGVFGGPERRQEITKTFDVTAKTGNLIIDSDNGKVEVIGNSGTQVNILATKVVNNPSDEAFNHLTFEATQQGNDIRITAKVKDPFFFSGFNSPRVELVINLPQEMVANVHTSNGKILLVNMANTAANHQLESSNGQIEVKQVTSSRVELKSSNGQLYINDFTGSLSAQTSNGTISATNSSINLERLNTSNGEVELNNIKLNQSNNGTIQTSNGSVKLDLDTTNSVRYEVSTGNGSINLNKSGLTFEAQEKHYVRTSGSGPTLKITTSNGSVTIG